MNQLFLQESLGSSENMWKVLDAWCRQYCNLGGYLLPTITSALTAVLRWHLEHWKLWDTGGSPHCGYLQRQPEGPYVRSRTAEKQGGHSW